MLWWLVSGTMGASEVMDSATSEAARAGAAIGTGIGVTMILIIWVIGAVITGLLALMTRPKG